METNADVEFIRENCDVMKAAYAGKCVLVIGQRVIRTFDDLTDGMLYTGRVLEPAEYALVDFSERGDNIYLGHGARVSDI